MTATIVSADVLLVGALLWAKPSASTTEVLRLVVDDDIESNAGAEVLAAARRLIESKTPAQAQLVFDELQRVGAIRDHNGVRAFLEAATTSGAEPMSLRSYASAVVGRSLRRRIASYGEVLSTAARESAEVELGSHVEQAARVIGDCAERLRTLRGELE